MSEIKKLILASASPRRLELLRQIGIDPIVAPVDIDESQTSGESVTDFVSRLSIDKARAGWIASQQQYPQLPVMGSDTIVCVEGHVLGKPSDEAHGIDMLTRLSGKQHQVHTAVAIVHDDKQGLRLSTTDVWMRELSLTEIRDYWATGEPRDKAGAYGLQGRGAMFVRCIQGSYSGVVGLPLFETAELLAEFGVTTN